MSSGLHLPYSVFVTAEQAIYVSNHATDKVVWKWTMNLTVSVAVMNLSSACYSVFVDINNTLYCSLDANHTVLAVSLDVGIISKRTIAGTGVLGSSSTELYNPNGIYVDASFNLYVADCYNNRIQFFKNSESNATTVVSTGVSGTISLVLPTAITLDGNGYYFIVDLGNHRIVGSGPIGFRCVAGCSGKNGSSSFQLSNPRSLAFDIAGNLFVADADNNRIQKFVLSTNSCGKLQYD